MQANVYIISGPSGTGKGTVCEKVIERPDMDAVIIRSCTTREKRFDNENYTFISVEEFLRKKEADEFLEFNYYANGHWYGSPWSEVKCALLAGRIPLLEIDINGYLQVLNSHKIPREKIYGVFIAADAASVAHRLINRNTENMNQVIMRLEQSIEEVKQIGLYDQLIINNDSDLTGTILSDFIKHPVRNSSANNSFIKKYSCDMKNIIGNLREKCISTKH